MPVRVRIKATPQEKQLDGIALDRFWPGSVREVPATLGAWLVAQGYAEPEMRHTPNEELEFGETVKPVRTTSHDRRLRRRSTDR